MPVNYEQLRMQMKKISGNLITRREAAGRAADSYLADLRSEAGKPDLDSRIEEALVTRPDLRCALPKDEPIDRGHPLQETVPVKTRLLACDGSQISPSRHDEISFGLINTAVMEFVSRSGEAPRITTRTSLLDFDDLPSEDMLGVRRDAAEKSFLAETAAAADPGILTFALCDGPLELFADLPELKDNQKYKDEYLEALSLLAEKRIPAAGYIDRPRSDPVLRMLDVLKGRTGAGDAKSRADDSMIFSRLLAPGERSAVFGMNSRLNRELAEPLRLCFFYMNIGRPDHPYISRVELPAWAAEGPIPDLLHAVLAEQCRMLGGHPYPFILHRSHECAVVSLAEREEIKGMLLREMAQNGMVPPEKSNKQIAKDLSRLSG